MIRALKLIFSVCLLLSHSAWATLALTNCVSGAATKTVTLAFTPSSTVGDGAILWTDVQSGSSPTVTITDNGGTQQTYVQVVCSSATNSLCYSGYVSNSATSTMFYVAGLNSSAYNGGSGITVTVSWSNNVAQVSSICEVSSGGVHIALDANSSNGAAGSVIGTSITSASLSTSNASDLLVYCIGATGTITSPVAGTDSQGGGSFTIPTGVTANKSTCEYYAAGATQSSSTTSLSWTSSRTVVSMYAAFQAVSSGAPPLLPLLGVGF